MTLWSLRSHLPWTDEHEAYEATQEWLRSMNNLLVSDGLDPFDFGSIPRSPYACSFAIQTGIALLSAVEALARGCSRGEAEAMFLERLPTPLES